MIERTGKERCQKMFDFKKDLQLHKQPQIHVGSI